MARLSIFVALLLALLSSVEAFLSLKARSATSAKLWMGADDESPTPKPFINRGVSINQDGESNVWAIEPKMEVDTKSSEEKSKGAFVAVGGLLAFGAVAAFVLTNLPDPNQF